MSALPLITAAELRTLVDDRSAVAALEGALLDGRVDVEADLPRSAVGLERGEFLLMPSQGAHHVGIKIATVAPGNPADGLPRIQGLYLLHDARTLAPVAIIDGSELTLIRTPAVSALVVTHVRRALGVEGPVPLLVVLGSGPQAYRHVRSLSATVGVVRVLVVGRRDATAEELAGRLRTEGVDAAPGRAGDVGRADVLVCATSSATPVVEDTAVGPDTLVVAIGAHGLGRREVPPELARRAQVVVEGVGSALRESGDLIPARSADDWRRTGLPTVADLVHGRFRPRPGVPVLYTGVGMSWEDLVIAEHAHRVRSG